MSITGLMRRLSLIDIDAIWQLSLGRLLIRTIVGFLRYTGYINFINGPISRVLLLILLVHVLLPRESAVLSGRVLDSRRKGRGFEHHRHHSVVVLEQDAFIIA